jgi:hypothetical protein
LRPCTKIAEIGKTSFPPRAIAAEHVDTNSSRIRPTISGDAPSSRFRAVVQIVRWIAQNYSTESTSFW